MKICTRREMHLGPKYSKGNKVRIKSPDFPGKVSYPGIKPYENMIGEILDSTNVVGFLTNPWARISSSDKRVTIYHYTVRINDQVTIFDVTEDYLEIVQ